MQAKTRNISTNKKSKNKLFKKKVIINPDDLKKMSPNVFMTKKEITQQNYKYNQMYNILFNKNKFKMKNDFDKKHSKIILNEKDKYLQPVNLDDSLSDEEDENVDVLNRISGKFTFGHH